MSYETVPKFLVLALAYYRAPLRYPALSDGRRELPDLVDKLLSAFGDAMSEVRLAESAEHLGCSVSELETAALFFIRQVLLAHGGTHYRVLGLSRDATAEQVKAHYRLIIRLFHPDRAAAGDEWSKTYAPRINEAYNVLRNPQKRAQYDASLKGPAPGAETALRTKPGVVGFSRSSSRRSKRHRKRSRGMRARFQLLPWAVGGLAALVMLVAIVNVLSRNDAVLRADPNQLTGEVPKPSFLQQAEDTAPPISSGMDEPVPRRQPTLDQGEDAAYPGLPRVPADSGRTIDSSAGEARLRVSPASKDADEAQSEHVVSVGGVNLAELGGKSLDDLDAGWVVQIASYTDKAHADAMLSQLRDAGFEGFLEEVTVTRTQYRVRVGPEAYRREAEKLRVVIEGSLQVGGQIERYP